MKYCVLIFCLFFSLTCFSQVRVRGYVRKNGTYVRPHIRSSPDGILWNNYSYKGGNSTLSSGSNFNFQSKNYLLGSSNTVTNSVANDVNKLAYSGENTPKSTLKSAVNESKKDCVKFDNELYFQKLKKIYDKKSNPNN